MQLYLHKTILENITFPVYIFVTFLQAEKEEVPLFP